MQVDEQLGSELFEQLPDAILVVDRLGIIRYANGQAGRLFRQEPAVFLSARSKHCCPGTSEHVTWATAPNTV
jgi:PAS domain-containing protein